MTQAAAGGHIQILKWAKKHGCPWNHRSVCEAAAANGHLDVLQWCKEQKFPFDAQMTDRAALGGHLAVVRWLVYNNEVYLFVHFLLRLPQLFLCTSLRLCHKTKISQKIPRNFG